MLTGEQKEKYVEIVAAETGRATTGNGRVYVPSAGGKPQETRLRLGLTDGNATEIVAGDVTEGAEVIVATADGDAAAKRPSSGAPRLPF